MSGEFIADYVQNCVSNGIQMPANIRKHAEDEIEKINEEIQKIEELRQRQSNLRAVVRHLGGGTKVAPNITVKAMDFSIPWEDLEYSFRLLCVQVCRIINRSHDGILPTEIMNIISDQKDHKAIYSAIKWLHQNDVLSRKENGGLQFGKKWDPFLSKVSDEGDWQEAVDG